MFNDHIKRHLLYIFLFLKLQFLNNMTTFLFSNNIWAFWHLLIYEPRVRFKGEHWSGERIHKNSLTIKTIVD